MDEELRDPEIEKLFKEIKLQEPSEQEMADFVSGVHMKIAQGYGARAVGFRQVGIVLAASVAFAGLVYLLPMLLGVKPAVSKPQITGTVVESKGNAGAPLMAPRGPEESIGRDKSHPYMAGSVVSKPLSIEDEMVVLEALSEEFPDETSDIRTADELLDELATLDELEISLPAPAQAG